MPFKFGRSKEEKQKDKELIARDVKFSDYSYLVAAKPREKYKTSYCSRTRRLISSSLYLSALYCAIRCAVCLCTRCGSFVVTKHISQSGEVQASPLMFRQCVPMYEPEINEVLHLSPTPQNAG